MGHRKSALASGHEAYHLGMSRIHQCSDLDRGDRSLAANALLRQEPDEDEDEEEDEGEDKEDDDDGCSGVSVPLSVSVGGR
jgi:hypothetical protein